MREQQRRRQQVAAVAVRQRPPAEACPSPSHLQQLHRQLGGHGFGAAQLLEAVGCGVEQQGRPLRCTLHGCCKCVAGDPRCGLAAALGSAQRGAFGQAGSRPGQCSDNSAGLNFALGAWPGRQALGSGHRAGRSGEAAAAWRLGARWLSCPLSRAQSCVLPDAAVQTKMIKQCWGAAPRTAAIGFCAAARLRRPVRRAAPLGAGGQAARTGLLRASTSAWSCPSSSGGWR